MASKKKAARQKAKAGRSKRRIDALNGADPSALSRRAKLLTVYFESFNGRSVPVKIVEQSELLSDCKKLYEAMQVVYGD